MIVTSIAIVMTVGLTIGLSACDALLNRFFGTPTTTQNEEITTPSEDPTHVHTIVVDEAVAPTCTETGLTEGKHCSTCNEVLVAQEVVPALGHQYSDYICTICSFADGTPYLEFKLLDDGTYEITGVKTNPPANLIIPSTYLGKKVTSIGYNAFFDQDLISVTIPDSITNIGDFAFAMCSSLNSIAIPDGVMSLGDFAFARCSNLTSITIPNSITSIGERTFEDCSSLTSITLPESLTNIDRRAFYNCTSLTSITIPSSVTVIDESTFDKCTALTSVTIPDSVTTIGNYAFYGCTNLTSVTIPNSVTSIRKEAFYGCLLLKSFTFEGTVEQWNNIYIFSDWHSAWLEIEDDDFSSHHYAEIPIPDSKVICTDGVVELN